ncbi:DUF5052 family protein [Desulfobacterota bacterium AH_259_B03_O07]|nr:DUF5052 family protein [Desulfobacterota bacterium AH_259_B03_O07]
MKKQAENKSNLPNGLTTIFLLALAGCVSLLITTGCGSDDSGEEEETPTPITVTIDNQVQLTKPCSIGDSLTFFENGIPPTPVDIAYQEQKKIQVSSIFDSYQIGFQVNGWYWRSCPSPGNCPNPSKCRNPDNAGQVGIEVTPGQLAGECSDVTLIKNWSIGICDSLVPNASDALTVTLEKTNPCTVRIVIITNRLQPTDACCACDTCMGSQIPPGQQTHCN